MSSAPLPLAPGEVPRPGEGRAAAASWAAWVNRVSRQPVYLVMLLDLVGSCPLLTKTLLHPLGLMHPRSFAWWKDSQAAAPWPHHDTFLPTGARPGPVPRHRADRRTVPGWGASLSSTTPASLAHSCLCGCPAQGPLIQDPGTPVSPPQEAVKVLFTLFSSRSFRNLTI